MALPGDSTLDPSTLAARSFNTSFRGYDPAEVREYLSALAEALRAQSRESDDGADALAEAERQLQETSDALVAEQDEVNRLEGVIADLQAEVERLESAPPKIETVSVAAEPVELDEATVTRYLGEETARVLAAARSAAADMTAKAETEVARRTDEIDQVQSKANREVAEQRAKAEQDAADLRAKAEQEAADLRAKAEAEVAAQRAELEAEAEAAAEAKREADAKAAADAEAAAISATAKAEDIVATAETEAARVRAEAEADLMASQETAKETTRSMVTEAQAVREKVLADLVVRRRMGRQQLDQAKAARDRLARSLVAVRREIDGTIGELNVAVPEARAAMEAVAQADSDTADAQAIHDLAQELDAARLSGISLVGDDEPAPLTVATGAAALDIEQVSERAEEAAAEEEAPADEPSAGEPDSPGAAAEVEPKGKVDDLFARIREDDDGDAAESADDDSVESSSGAEVEAAESDASATEDDASGAEDEVEAEPDIEVPDAFVQRDVAMTRHGAELRRKLKRTMADDQSDVLDRLRRAKKMSVGDLQPADEQRALYVAAITEPVRATAKAGATYAGGSVKNDVVDALIERVIGELTDPLRHRLEQSVEAASDAEEVLEPIRAHYREARSSELPQLADDVLAEAFALGAYEAIPDGTTLRWLADPRFEPGADCFDNTLATDVAKPDAFPTGRQLPGSEPGCRCLVLPAD